MSTGFLKFNELKNSLTVIHSQKKHIETMLNNLLSSNSFHDFRTHYFSELLIGNDKINGTRKYMVSEDPVTKIINDLFLRQTGMNHYRFDEAWKYKLRLIVDEKNIQPYQRVGKILELFKEWRNYTGCTKLKHDYYSCQKELQNILNYFLLEEIKQCKGALIDHPVSMSQIFHDYRQCYVDGLHPSLKLDVVSLESYGLSNKQYIKNKRAYQAFYKNKKTWCDNHHWAEVLLFENKIFKSFSYSFMNPTSKINNVINSHMLVINKIMFETHPDHFDRDKISKILLNAIKKLDFYEKPLSAIDHDIQTKKNSSFLHDKKSFGDILNEKNLHKERNLLIKTYDFSETYDFSVFDEIMSDINRISDPDHEINKLDISEEEKKKISWDAWGMVKESAYGRPSILSVYDGEHRKELRREAFSFDYTIFKSPKFMNSTLASKIDEDIKEFMKVDVPCLPNVLDVAVSMGFSGDELNKMVQTTIENIEKQNAHDDAQTMTSDLKRLDENLGDLSTLL